MEPLSYLNDFCPCAGVWEAGKARTIDLMGCPEDSCLALISLQQYSNAVRPDMGDLVTDAYLFMTKPAALPERTGTEPSLKMTRSSFQGQFDSQAMLCYYDVL